MGCGSCSSGGCSTSGCGRNGGCATGGCNKLNTFDWLRNMLPPDRTEVDNIYEIRFKNTRKSFYRNVNGLRLYNGDFVVVESDRGFDVGQISLGGVMAELQMRKKNFKKKGGDIPRIYRKANETDLELLQELREKEMPVVSKSRTIIRDLKLEMKLSDVEYQGDGTKAIFYYIADHRVDFRELIKLLAREFRIRVEMKQIGLRHEAALLGGIGACGRELCCSTWLTDFKTVSTAAARYQNLSLNPMKISGLCGRLKCCLNFELESYMDALQGFPKVEKIKTQKGIAFLQKTDIFKGVMWFSYPDETSWYPLNTDEVKDILAKNERGEEPESLAVMANEKAALEAESTFDFVDVVGTELPELPERRNKKKRRKKRPAGKPEAKKQAQKPQGKGETQEKRAKTQNRRQGQQKRQQPNKANKSGSKQGQSKQNQSKQNQPKQGQQNQRQSKQNQSKQNQPKQGQQKQGQSKQNQPKQNPAKQGKPKQGSASQRPPKAKQKQTSQKQKGNANQGGKDTGNKSGDQNPQNKNQKKRRKPNNRRRPPRKPDQKSS